MTIQPSLCHHAGLRGGEEVEEDEEGPSSREEWSRMQNNIRVDGDDGGRPAISDSSTDLPWY